MSPYSVYYYEPQYTWQEHVRELARECLLSLSCWINKLPWQLRISPPIDILVDHIWDLWIEWYHESPEEVMSAVHGEIPLHAMSDFQRAHFVDFDQLHWHCMECSAVYTTAEIFMDSHDGICPHCASRCMYLVSNEREADYWRERHEAHNQSTTQASLLLTERRAA